MMRCPCFRERLHPKAHKPGVWWACEPCAIAGWSIRTAMIRKANPARCCYRRQRTKNKDIELCQYTKRRKAYS